MRAVQQERILAGLEAHGTRYRGLGKIRPDPLVKFVGVSTSCVCADTRGGYRPPPQGRSAYHWGVRNSGLPVISLFSGAGGLDLAVHSCGEPPLIQNGSVGPYRVAVATDYAEDALKTLTNNMPAVPTIAGDIRDVSVEQILETAEVAVGDAALLVGGPPCTPFSKSGFHIEAKRTSSDPDASLLDEYVRVVDGARPEAFVLENVQGLTYRTHSRQFQRLLSSLAALGYNPQWKVLLAAEHGVPQLRRRVFVIGRRDGGQLRFPVATHSGVSERDRKVDQSKLPFVTAGEAIGHLLPGIPQPGEIAEGTFADLAASVPPGENYLWHTERGGGEPRFVWRSRYWTFLLRLSPDRPSTTLQAQPGPWVGPFHWENVLNGSGEPRARRLRLPEILALMTFPEDFAVVGDRQKFQRQLGNAVPVELGKIVIRAVAEQLGHLDPTLELASGMGEARGPDRLFAV